MPYDSFYFGPDNTTVYGKQGDVNTGFKTEAEALAAGVQKNPSYNPASPNSAANPYYSNVAFPSAGIPTGSTGIQVPSLISADLLTSTVNPPQVSLQDQFNQARTQRGLPALYSAQQDLLKSILEQKSALRGGITYQEGRPIAMPIIGAEKQRLEEQIQKNLQPLIDTYELNANQIKNINENIMDQLGFAAKDREFQAQLHQNAVNNAFKLAEYNMSITNKQRDDARAIINEVVTQFGGLEFDKLPADAQFALSQAAATSGYPLGVLKMGMKTIAEQKLQARLASQMSLQQQRQFQNEIALSNLQLRQFSAELAKEKFENANAPLDIAADVQTTASGRNWIDLSKYAPGERAKARKAADASGIAALTSKEAESIREVNNARLNETDIINQFKGFLPKDPEGRIAGGALQNIVSKYVQSDVFISSVGSLRAAAIQALRATAGSKGLRINQAEIQLAVENDIPKITDTVGTAIQKYNNIMLMLDNAESATLVRDQRALLDIANIVKSQSKGYSAITGTGIDRVNVLDPNGKLGSIPRSQLDEALRLGYKQQ